MGVWWHSTGHARCHRSDTKYATQRLAVQVWLSLQLSVMTLDSTDTWVLSTPTKSSKLCRKKKKKEMVINQKFVVMQEEEPGRIHQQMVIRRSCFLAQLVQLFLPLQISHITGLSHPYPHLPGSHLYCAEATDDHTVYHGTALLFFFGVLCADLRFEKCET